MTSKTTSGEAAAVPSLFILTFMASLGPFGDTEYTPSLPAIADAMGIAYGQAQLTMTVYLFGFAFGQLLYGPCSDRFGRRPAILFAISAFLTGSLICALSSDLNLLLLGRLVQSLGACAGGVISNAAVRDAFPASRQTRVFLQVNTAFSLAPGIGPIAGSLIDHYGGWRANFVLLAVLAVLLLISLLYGFAETNRHRMPEATRPRYFLKTYAHLLLHPVYVYYAVLVGLGIGVIYCSLVEAPQLVMVELGLPSKTFVMVAAGIVGGFVLGAACCGLLGRYCSDAQLILIGLFIMLAGTLAIGFFAYLNRITLTNMLGAIALIYVGIAFVVPVATSRALAPFENMAGSASSLLGCIGMTLASVSTYFISLLPLRSPGALFVTFSVLTGLSLLLSLAAHLVLKSKL